MKTTGLRLFFLLLLCVPVGLNAQVANANMNVIVQDSTGAVVPGATVKVINSQTGLEGPASRMTGAKCRSRSSR